MKKPLFSLKKINPLATVALALAMGACGGPRDPAQTKEGLIFELKKPGVTLSKCRGGSDHRIFIHSSVAQKISKLNSSRTYMKPEVGTYSCHAIGSRVQMMSPGLKANPSDFLHIHKIQLIYRDKLNIHHARAAGFSDLRGLHRYLDRELQFKKNKGFKIFNNDIVTMTYFTYQRVSSGSSHSPPPRNFRPIQPVKITKEGQRLFSCASHKSDWIDIWLKERFESLKDEIQRGEISVQMSAGATVAIEWAIKSLLNLEKKLNGVQPQSKKLRS